MQNEPYQYYNEETIPYEPPKSYDHSNDLYDPMNPISPLNLFNPLNPFNSDSTSF